MEHNHEVLDDLREATRSLRHAMPETWAAFQSLHGAAMADGEIRGALKEGWFSPCP
jgi:hypothetical protein